MALLEFHEDLFWEKRGVRDSDASEPLLLRSIRQIWNPSIAFAHLPQVFFACHNQMSVLIEW
jgi:hypothetical protein